MTASVDVRNQFEEILEAARTQDRSNQAATMVVLSHLQQMTLLMIKKGLSFYCDQDTYKSRTKFIHDVIELNRLDIRYLQSSGRSSADIVCITMLMVRFKKLLFFMITK